MYTHPLTRHIHTPVSSSTLTTQSDLVPGVVLRYSYQLADIMYYLEDKGVVHLNLLPENIQVKSWHTHAHMLTEISVKSTSHHTVCTLTHAFVYSCVDIHVFMYMYSRVHTRAYSWSYTHTCTHILIHMYMYHSCAHC